MIYDFSTEYCSTGRPGAKISIQECNERARRPADSMVTMTSDMSLADLGSINSVIRSHPGFKDEAWQTACRSMCGGQEVAYQGFEQRVCSIKRLPHQ